MSMERYADSLTGALREHARYEVAELTPHVAPLPDGSRAGWRRYVTRMLSYPAVAARQPADIYHVIDHGYAHAIARLPKDRTVRPVEIDMNPGSTAIRARSYLVREIGGFFGGPECVTREALDLDRRKVTSY